MKWTDVKDNWTAFVPRLRTRWQELKENDLLDADGSRPEVARHLSQATGTTVQDADAMLAEWLEGLEPADAVMDPHRDNVRISASRRDIPPGEDVYSDDRDFGDGNTAEPPAGRS